MMKLRCLADLPLSPNGPGGRCHRGAGTRYSWPSISLYSTLLVHEEKRNFFGCGKFQGQHYSYNKILTQKRCPKVKSTNLKIKKKMPAYGPQMFELDCSLPAMVCTNDTNSWQPSVPSVSSPYTLLDLCRVTLTLPRLAA